jgi:hypothetical protein
MPQGDGAEFPGDGKAICSYCVGGARLHRLLKTPFSEDMSQGTASAVPIRLLFPFSQAGFSRRHNRSNEFFSSLFRRAYQADV